MDRRTWMNPSIDLDGILKRWPAPTRPDSFWEARADAIVRAALTEEKDAKLFDALMNAPLLLREAGDPSVSGASASASCAAAPEPPAKRKSSGGFIAGVAIATIGLAAAFAIVQRDRLTPPAMPPASAPVEARLDGPAERPVPEQTPPRAAAAQTESPAERPAAPPAPVAVSKAPRSDSAAVPPRASAAPELAQGPSTTATPGETKPGPTGTAMPDDHDGINNENALRDHAPPADSGDKHSTIPQQPAQGSLSAALRSGMGGAKKCVTGASDVSRATITFSSDGAVKSVAVTGWAASNGATGCILSALKSANVGRFWKASFTVSVAIQP